jgi:uncharacterized protein YndB with AHSA1/START domain
VISKIWKGTIVAKPRHLHETYIKTTPQALWTALTDPDFTERYFFGTRLSSTLEPNSAYVYTGEYGPAVDGTIIEAEPFRRLVMTWHVLWDDEARAEQPTKVTWEITPVGDVCRLTLLHEDFGGLSKTWSITRTGWRVVIDGLKTLLETGEAIGPIPDDRADESVDAVDLTAEEHRERGIEVFNATWALVDKPDRTPDDNEAMIRAAYAAAYHWSLAARRTVENEVRGEWMLSRVHALAGFGETALRHANRCLRMTEAAGLTDFDLGFAHEAMARSLACLGRGDEARRHLAIAKGTPVADPEDRAIFEGDLVTEPWFGIR